MSSLMKFLIVLFVSCAYAAKPLGHEVCVASCYYSLLKAKYAGASSKAQTACTNKLRVQSTYYCMKLHCEEEDIEPGVAWWAGTCANSTKVVNVEAYKSTTASTTESYLSNLPTVKQKEKNIFNGTAVPSKDNWEIVYRSVYTYSEMRDYHNAVRWIPYGFWAIILLAGMASRAWHLMSPRPQNEQPSSEPDNGNKGLFGRVKRMLKFDLLLSPTFTYRHHQRWGWFTVPTRLQSLTILSYVILHIILSAVHYPIYDESYYYSSRQVQILRYFGDRLGGLMSSSLPWLFLFGGRSNPFTLLTGWSYRTFSLFHRWVAIVLLVESIIHGVVFSAYYVSDKGWDTYRENLKDDDKFLYGIMAAVAMGLSVGFAFAEIRKRAYELFKATHIVLAVITLAAFYEHIKSQFVGVYKVWVWVCIAVWGFDYVCRVGKMLFMNYRSLIGRNTPAVVSYSEETGMIRLQVYPSIVSEKQTPGRYYFLYFGGSRFWQSHPFSLAGHSRELNETAALAQPLDTSEKKGANLSSQAVEPTDSTGKPYLTFLIRPRDGVTRRLRDLATTKGSSGRCRLGVAIEGPYGASAEIRRFNDVLFVAGGSGITAILPYIRTLFEDNQKESQVPNVRLAWTVRHEGFARDVLSNDLNLTEASPQASEKLSLEIFITSNSTGSETTSLSDPNGQYSPDSRFKEGRPDINSIVQNFVGGAKGSAAVFVCGPGKMADDTRLAVIRHGKNSSKHVELFEEMYGW